MQTASSATVNSRSVRILNPIKGGSNYTNRHSAKRYVRRGYAVWCDDTRTGIWFIESGKSKGVVLSVVQQRTESETGYDRVRRRMTISELAAIPMLMPAKLLRGARERAI